MSSFDIFNRIKSLLNIGSSGTKENSLKRRAPEPTEHPTVTKYRRVSNVFPKVINKPFEDDTHFLQPRVVDCMNMSDRKSSENPNNSNNNRGSSTNLPYADIEYSDEEDDIIFTNRRHRPHAYSSSMTNQKHNSNHSINKNTRVTAVLPDHIPILVRNRPSLVNRTTSTINGNFAETPISNYKAFESSSNKSFLKHDNDTTWHRRLTANRSGTETKSIPGLIEAKTGRLTTQCFPPIPPLRKSSNWSSHLNTSRKYMNGFNSSESDHMKGDIKMGNGIPSTMSKSSAAPSQMSANVPAENNSNSVVTTTYNLKEQHGYMQLLRKLVPGIYKSNNSEKDRHRLAQLAEARDSSQRRSDFNRTNNKIGGNISLIDEFENLSKDVVIDLSDDDVQVLSACRKVQANKIPDDIKRELLVVEPVNSFKDRLDSYPPYKSDWLIKFKDSFASKRQLQRKQISVEEENVRMHTEETERQEKLLEQSLKNFKIDTETIILDESDSEEDIEFPELTDDQKTAIKRAEIGGPEDEVLVSKFNMNITRRDIRTLRGREWLNDEVINFYMNLLMERGEERNSEGLPRVYAMNTFFVPRLLQSGHSAVRRWTRKVDIFSYDLIPVPVHVGKMHWCMAIIHLRNKTIKYYDSMGTPNPRVLYALEEYLREESLDKRKEPFDTSKFAKESVAEAPRQDNGYDCGVFSCMFAEYISRGREITFTQQHMSYFRQKMILEIIQGKLLL